jgi:hypothetical protein
MANQLPILPSLKVSGSTVFVGDPKQLVDLLSTEVAQAVIEVHRTKGNMPLYKCKLRCKTLFQGNLDVAILVDYPNIPVTVRVSDLDAAKEEAVFSLVDTSSAVDAARALRFQASFQEAIGFWSAKMEDEVVKVYTDKIPKQIGSFAQSNIVEGKINVFQGRAFDSSAFFANCLRNKALPAFKIAYGWIGSQEDARSEEHIWGFKFEMSIFPQYTTPKKAPELSKKKRKADGEGGEVAAVEIAEIPVE